jgi:hypothetical protein
MKMKKKKERPNVLIADRDKLRDYYIKLYKGTNFDTSNDPDKLDLILYRTELLFRNPLFVKEYIDLINYKKKSNYSPDIYRDREVTFSRKWSYDFHIHLSNAMPYPVKAYGTNERYDGVLTLKVDLKYSKKKIMKELELVIDDYHKAYRELLEEELGEFIRTPDSISKITPGYKADFEHGVQVVKKGLNVLLGNIKSDLNDYNRSLNIWDMKEIQQLSWKETVQKWNSNNQYQINIDTARNWHASAKKLIKKGIPGFLAFPAQ